MTNIPPLDLLRRLFEIDAEGFLIRRRIPQREDYGSQREFSSAKRFAGVRVTGAKCMVLGSVFDAAAILSALKTGARTVAQATSQPPASQVHHQLAGPEPVRRDRHRLEGKTMHAMTAGEALPPLRNDLNDAKGRGPQALANARCLAGALELLPDRLLDAGARADADKGLEDCLARGGIYALISFTTLERLVRALDHLITRVA